MRLRSATTLVTAVAFALGAPGCAAKRPVLYPNPHLEAVGKEASQRDIDACIALAEESGADKSRAGEVAGNTAGGAAIGGATGAATGAITGAPGTGAAAGAAGGAILGFFRGLFGAREPDPVFANFVNQCLADPLAVLQSVFERLRQPRIVDDPPAHQDLAEFFP